MWIDTNDVLVEIVDAVDLVVEVDSEGNSVEALVTNAATKTSGMVIIAHGLENLDTKRIEISLLE